MDISLISAWCLDKSTQRLALALVVSVLLHWALIDQPLFFRVGWPVIEPTPLQATLAQRPVVPTPSAHPSIPTIAPEPVPTRAVSPEPVAPVAPITEPSARTAQATAMGQTPESDTSFEQAEPADVLPEDDMPLEIVEDDAMAVEPDAIAVEPDAMANGAESKAPTYAEVRTEFDVFMNGEPSRVGTATIAYQRKEDGGYKLRWDVKASGLLALLYPNLVQTSEGDITVTGLRPKQYRYQFGNRADKTYEAQFNWADNVLMLKTAKGEKWTDMSDNAQDILSFMYQFMFVPPLSNMQMHLTNGKKLAVYDYAFEGEEILPLAWGEVSTYHLSHAKTQTEDKTELWLAADYQFVPVKIRKTEKNGTVIEQLATSITAQ